MGGDAGIEDGKSDRTRDVVVGTWDLCLLI